MRTAFSKMHGLGNDFVLVDGTEVEDLPAALDPSRVRRLGDRHRGIGFDQLLVAVPPTRPEAHIGARVFNADGGEVGQCGNGLRCFAVFARERGLVSRSSMCIEVAGRLVRAEVLADGEVRVDMGAPAFEPDDIPFVADARAPSYVLQCNGEELRIGAVSLGNPHAVVRVPEVDDYPVVDLAPSIQAHTRFPASANVGFMQVIGERHVRLRVYERGVGETLACGSGACAAAVVGRENGWLDDAVDVDLPGGSLRVQWTGNGYPVWLTGPTTWVYEGEVST